MTASRPRLAVYWASGCGGCEATFLELGEALLELDRTFDIVLFPLLMDGRLDALERLGPGELDLALVSGALRTAYDLETVCALRDRASLLVALGACAHTGGVLSLANPDGREALLRSVRGDAETEARSSPPGIGVPELLHGAYPLERAVRVDAVIPGCPPEADTLRAALHVLAEAVGGRAEPPPAGAVLGATDRAVCEECPHEPPEQPIVSVRRLHEVTPDPDRCLLEQGLICLGPATRGGCGAPCPRAGAPCRGCYGPLPGIEDAGARMLGAFAALAAPRTFEETSATEAARRLGEAVPDPLGTFYRYTLASSLLGRLATPGGEDATCDG